MHLSVRDHGLAAQPPGPLDHFALQCTGLEEMQQRLVAHGIAFTTERVPEREQTQIFLSDPSGLALELNFAGSVAC